MTGSTIAEADGEYFDLDETFAGFEEFDTPFQFGTRLESDVFADINWPEDHDRDSTPQVQTQEEEEEADDVPQLHRSVSFAPSSKRGKSDPADSVSPLAPVTDGSAANGGSRFSRQARSILRVWFNEHKDNPYPTSDEKDELAAQTGLKRSQISLWLVNTRRKYRSRKHQHVNAGGANSSLSPSMTGSSSSPQSQQNSEDIFKPMDRWKVLPLDLEATPAPTILAAVANATEPAPEEVNPFSGHTASLWDYDLQSSAADLSQYDTFWSQSMASYETGVFSGSTISDSTALSYPYLGPTFSSVSSQSARTANGERRRRRCLSTKPKLTKTATKDRPFHCTFGCGSAFATKHDWQRHEKSQHLSLESWTCCVSGGTVETINGQVCAFCDHPEPDTKHLETHNFSECQDRDLAERTFYRKDHFQQHLRLTHETKFHPRMESWKAEVGVIKSRCGFCNAEFSSWAARADHLAAHFKCHVTMKDWSGDLGFEPHIAAIVERATVQVGSCHPQLSIPSMPPPKHPASYYNAGLGGGAGGDVTPLIGYPYSLEGDLGLDMNFGLDSTALGLETTAVTDFGNVDMTNWASFGV